VDAVYVSFTTEATVDWEDEVDESNEDNNSRQLAMDVGEPGLPDLVVDGLSISPSNPDWGDSIEVSVGVRNQGTAPSGSYSVLFRYGSGDFDVCEWPDQPSLAAGGRIDLSCSVDEVYVDYTTEATVDWRDEIDESNEDNNSRQRAMDVGPHP
jgi:subtilase family serine protease